MTRYKPLVRSDLVTGPAGLVSGRPGSPGAGPGRAPRPGTRGGAELAADSAGGDVNGGKEALR